MLLNYLFPHNGMLLPNNKVHHANKKNGFRNVALLRADSPTTLTVKNIYTKKQYSLKMFRNAYLQ